MTIPGIPFQNPLSYKGPTQNIVPIRMLPREPSASDTHYPIGFMAIIGKYPDSGTEGDLWYLSEFDSNGHAVWKLLLTGSNSPGIVEITTDDGSPPVEPDIDGNINILAGNGIQVTGNGPGDTVIVSSVGFLFHWTVVIGTTQYISVNNGYFSNNGSGVTFTLPVTASVGDIFVISSMNAGGWTIAQNAGQDIRMGESISTVGVGGFLSSSLIGDSVTVVCYIEDTSFMVISQVGYLNIV